jgi:hypothetical protein
MWWRGWSARRATRLMARVAVGLMLAVGMLVFGHPQESDARSRGVTIGIGVGTGLQILRGLEGKPQRYRSYRSHRSSGRKSSHKSRHVSRKSESKSRRASSKRSRKTTTAKSVDPVEDADDSVPAADGSIPADNGSVPATPTETGSTGQGASPPAPAAAMPTGVVVKISTPAEITSAQEHLRYLGYDIPSTSGRVDLATRIAVMKFQDSLKVEPTGELTVDQLQQLYVLASEKQKGGRAP